MKASMALVVMMKNEAESIERCIASVRPDISAYCLVDTGSTDETIDLAEKALDGLRGRTYRLPFVNFGHSRSETLAMAHGIADWLLLADADMEFTIDPTFEPDPSVEAYTLRMGTGDFLYRLPLLVRGDLPWRSVGVVHEYLALPSRAYVGVPTDAVRVTYEDRSSPAKSAWHAELLEAEIEKHPDDARSVFYLAQTYRDLGRFDEARELYKRRATMGGFAEECFYAAFRGALLEPDWPARSAGLMAAWEMRPSRLEPLYELAKELNSRGQHNLSYRLTSVLTDMPQDALFVHTGVWSWGMTFERSISAWWVGEYDEALRLCDELLANPNLPEYVRKQVDINRAFSITKLAA